MKGVQQPLMCLLSCARHSPCVLAMIPIYRIKQNNYAALSISHRGLFLSPLHLLEKDHKTPFTFLSGLHSIVHVDHATQSIYLEQQFHKICQVFLAFNVIDRFYRIASLGEFIFVQPILN